MPTDASLASSARPGRLPVFDPQAALKPKSGCRHAALNPNTRS